MKINKQTIHDLKPEQIVIKFLKDRKFYVSNLDKKQEANGIDVVAIKDNKHFLIEVKSVCVGKKNMTITKVQKSGLFCTHIAIVTPKKKIIFQSMKDHLKLCSKLGTRGVTELVSFYDSY